MATVGKTTGKMAPGNWAVLRYGIYDVLVRILEDYGELGGEHRHIYSVRMLQDGEPLEFAAVEDSLSLFDRSLFAEYFRRNLISILAQGTPVSKPTRAWLRLDGRGDVTHTFIKESGMLGGVAIPYLAFDEDRIFLPHVEAVRDFLQEFGLSRSQADSVIESVGTSPSRPR